MKYRDSDWADELVEDSIRRAKTIDNINVEYPPDSIENRG